MVVTEQSELTAFADLQEMVKVTSVRNGQCPNCFERQFNTIKDEGEAEATERTVERTMKIVNEIRDLLRTKTITTTVADKMLKVNTCPLVSANLSCRKTGLIDCC